MRMDSVVISVRIKQKVKGMPLIGSSAIVKYFSKEPGWQAVEWYISISSTVPLALPELGNALLKKLSKKEIDEDTASKILEGYSSSAILLDQNKYLLTAFVIASSTGRHSATACSSLLP